MIADQLSILKRLTQWLNLPLVTDKPINFETLRARYPGKDLRGVSEGYERYYSARQLDLLWDRHGAVATEYGYAPPDRTIACPDEQVRRLDILISAAWERNRLLCARLDRMSTERAGRRR